MNTKKEVKKPQNVLFMVQYGDSSLCFSHVDIFCKTRIEKFVNKKKIFLNLQVYGTMNSDGDPLCFDLQELR